MVPELLQLLFEGVDQVEIGVGLAQRLEPFDLIVLEFVGILQQQIE